VVKGRHGLGFCRVWYKVLDMKYIGMKTPKAKSRLIANNLIHLLNENAESNCA
jgi:hypothetical protein